MKKLTSLLLALSLLLLSGCGTRQQPPVPDGEVSVSTLPTHDSLVAMLATGECEIAVLPEPKVTAALMQNTDYEVALNLSTEWSSVSDHDLAMGCIVVRNDFLRDHEGAVKHFLDRYRRSVAFISDEQNRDAAASKIVAAGVLPKLPIASSALKNLSGSIVYSDGDAMKNTLSSFYTAIGQQQPSDAFYATAQSTQNDGQTIRIGVMSGPTGMGMADLMTDEAQTQFVFTVYSDPSAGTADLTSGTIDMLCLPTNTAATLSDKKPDFISVVAVNCLGSLFVVAKKELNIRSIDDLIGKTVYTSVPNSTTRPILSYILQKNDLAMRLNDE